MNKLTPEDNKQIEDEIKCETRAAMERQGHSYDRIAREIALIAYSDIGNYYTINDAGELQLKPLKGQKRRVVKKIKEKSIIAESKDGSVIYKRNNVEVELYDKGDMLKFAASLMGMVKPKEMKLSGSLGLVNDADISDEEREAVLQASRLMREKMNGKSRSSKKAKSRTRKG